MLFVYQVTLLTNYFWINRNLCPFLSVPKGIMYHRPYNNYLLCLFVSFISHYQTQLHCTLTWWSLVDHAKMLGKIGCALCAQWCFAVVMWKVIWWNTIQRNQATCWLWALWTLVCGAMTVTRVSLSFCCTPERLSLISRMCVHTITRKGLEALTLHNCGSKAEKLHPF